MMNLNASLDDAVTSSSSFTALLELPPTQVVKLLRDETQPHAFHPFTDSIVQLLNHNLENLNYHTAVPDPPLEDEFEVRTLSVKGKKLPEKRKKRIKEEEKEDDEEEVVRGPKGRKRSKKEEIGQSQLPYVHVRARRGQATDSHSLAERARREKINARMKLLQELVPGCSKISGIALVLDEIINHVQALQRQVEFLSMQLAAVNPRIEFNLDQLMDDENAVVECSLLSVKQPLEWTDPQGNGLSGFKCSFGQQWQCDAYQHPQWLKEENNQLESVAMPDTTHLRNASSPEMGCVFLRQLKVEQT